MTTTTIIPLIELLSLNYLSNYTLLYEHETPPPPPSSILDKTNNNNSVELQQLKLKSLNASKLSLLIVKAIADDNNDANTTINNPSEITDEFAVDTNGTSTNGTTKKSKSAYQMSNFHIKLKLPNSKSISNCVSNGVSNGIDKDNCKT